MSSDAGAAGPLLLDLPKPLLQLCVQKCSSSVLSVLIATSRQLRDIVTELATPTCAVHLPASHGATLQLQAMLNLASKRSKLKLWQHEDNYWEEQDIPRFVQGNLSLRFGQLFHAVTALHLVGLILEEVVPRCLAAACPNLQQLELESCAFRISSIHPLGSPAACQQLVTLRIWDQFSQQQRTLPTEMLKAALQGMPSLTTLHLACQNNWPSKPFWDALSTVSTQLVHLGFTAEMVSDIQPLRKFTAVRTLNLGRRSVHSTEDMDALLQMQSLRVLSIGGKIDLQVSMVHRTCHWESLEVSWPHGITLLSLACLPLSGVQRLAFRAIYGLGVEAQVAALAMANVAKCQLIDSNPYLSLHFHSGPVLDNQQPGTCFHGLGILQHVPVTTVVLTERATAAVITALGQYLPASVTAVHFGAGADDEAVRLMMVALPSTVSEIEFDRFTCWDADRLSTWLDTLCRTTRRHVRIVYYRLVNIAEHVVSFQRRTVLVLPCWHCQQPSTSGMQIPKANAE